jgi:hypothetical protein
VAKASDQASRPLLADLLELLRDAAAEELHRARLLRELGRRLLDEALGKGAAENLRGDVTATLVESVEALRKVLVANLTLGRTLISAQGRATDWLAGVFDDFLAAQENGRAAEPAPAGEAKPEAKPDTGEPRLRPPGPARHGWDERRAQFQTVLRVVDELWRNRVSASATGKPTARGSAGEPVVVRCGREGGTATMELEHTGREDVHAAFHVGPCVRVPAHPVGRGATGPGIGGSFRARVHFEPEELTVRPRVIETVHVSVPWDERFEAGATYRIPVLVAGLERDLFLHVVTAPDGEGEGEGGGT